MSNWGGYAVTCGLYLLNSCPSHQRYLSRGLLQPINKEETFQEWASYLPSVKKVILSVGFFSIISLVWLQPTLSYAYHLACRCWQGEQKKEGQDMQSLFWKCFMILEIKTFLFRVLIGLFVWICVLDFVNRSNIKKIKIIIFWKKIDPCSWLGQQLSSVQQSAIRPEIYIGARI